jgi:ATP-dependent helicase/nuclease subunit A
MLVETEHEYRRLLYVAMTRAADRLIIAGCQPGNMNGVRKDSWYDLARRGLAASGLTLEEIPAGDGLVKRYRLAEDAAPQAGAASDVAPSAPPALPSWLLTAAAPERSADRRLRPSDPVDNEGKVVRGGEAMALRARALQRGVLVHRLLQSLPDLAVERRRELAQNYLAGNAKGWTAEERDALVDRVLTLITDSRFAAVFAAGSRAEVPIVGRLERPGGPPALVSGQIDRLVVMPAEILIVDYKTNHAPPATAAEAPEGYVRQLALYRAVLSRLYPQRSIRAALLWTETPDLIEISAPALDAGLALLSSPREPA